MTDKTLDYIVALFEQGRRLQQTVTITEDHIKVGEFSWYWRLYRFDEALFGAILHCERYYATQPGYKDGCKVNSVEDLIKS